MPDSVHLGRSSSRPCGVPVAPVQCRLDGRPHLLRPQLHVLRHLGRALQPFSDPGDPPYAPYHAPTRPLLLRYALIDLCFGMVCAHGALRASIDLLSIRAWVVLCSCSAHWRHHRCRPRTQHQVKSPILHPLSLHPTSPVSNCVLITVSLPCLCIRLA